MPVTVYFKVAAARTEPGSVTAMLEGKPVAAMAERLVADLVSADGSQTITLRLPIVSTDDLAEQKAEFAIGQTIPVSLGYPTGLPVMDAQPASPEPAAAEAEPA